MMVPPDTELEFSAAVVVWVGLRSGAPISCRAGYDLRREFVADAVALRTEDAECVSKFGVEVFGGIASIRS